MDYRQIYSFLVILSAILMNGRTQAQTQTSFSCSMKFTDLTYASSLADVTSSQYLNLVRDLKISLDSFFRIASVGTKETRDFRFTPGSVVADFTLDMDPVYGTSAETLRIRVIRKLTEYNYNIGSHDVDPNSVVIEDPASGGSGSGTAAPTAAPRAYPLSLRLLSVPYVSGYGSRTTSEYQALETSVERQLTQMCTLMYGANCREVRITRFRDDGVNTWVDFEMMLDSSQGYTDTKVDQDLRQRLSNGNLGNVYTVDFGGTSGGLSTGEIAGIAVAIILLIIIIVIVVVLCCLGDKRRVLRGWGHWRNYRYDRRKSEYVYDNDWAWPGRRSKRNVGVNNPGFVQGAYPGYAEQISVGPAFTMASVSQPTVPMLTYPQPSSYHFGQGSLPAQTLASRSTPSVLMRRLSDVDFSHTKGFNGFVRY